MTQLLFRLRVLRASARLFLSEYRYYRDYCDESRRSALRWSWVICKHRVVYYWSQGAGLPNQQLTTNH